MLQLLRPLVRGTLSRSISLDIQKMQRQIPNRKVGEVPEKIKRAQKLFQEKNGLPVFLKGGKKDKILYYTTLGLAGFGLILNVKFLVGYIID